ncbi:unnamed protein product [Protopolystoma xenopodis]|uniref:Uncharacterized protein n=1 Tax=Protopolystoma xenopodis TaxID=117903 RepID=A0A3S5FCK6_9PLAT|nr:unnamed protein product [Protopolystoma xenopodis]
MLNGDRINATLYYLLSNTPDILSISFQSTSAFFPDANFNKKPVAARQPTSIQRPFPSVSHQKQADKPVVNITKNSEKENNSNGFVVEKREKETDDGANFDSITAADTRINLASQHVTFNDIVYLHPHQLLSAFREEVKPRQRRFALPDRKISMNRTMSALQRQALQKLLQSGKCFRGSDTLYVVV